MLLTCVWSFVDKPAVGFNRYKNMSCRIKSNNKPERSQIIEAEN